jgi:hypothetical protein
MEARVEAYGVLETRTFLQWWLMMKVLYLDVSFVPTIFKGTREILVGIISVFGFGTAIRHDHDGIRKRNKICSHHVSVEPVTEDLQLSQMIVVRFVVYLSPNAPTISLVAEFIACMFCLPSKVHYWAFISLFFISHPVLVTEFVEPVVVIVT